jgi:hypothetical protein
MSVNKPKKKHIEIEIPVWQRPGFFCDAGFMMAITKRAGRTGLFFRIVTFAKNIPNVRKK